MTGLYSDSQIKNELNEGNIVIEPYNEEQLNNCSYDVRLGEYYFSSNYTNYLNPWYQPSIDSYWGSAKRANFANEKNDLGLSKGQQYIILQPGELILGHTIEFIGTRKNAASSLRTKSTLGRCGISICKCSGHIDCFYHNRITMEICNDCRSPVVLIVGQRIGQVLFHPCGPTENPYYKNGTYQTSDNMEDLIKNWKPEMMLPRAKLGK